MNAIRALLLSLLFVAGTASAHRDVILPVRPDGSIPSVPRALGPVSLNISGLGSSNPTVKFRSGKHTNVLPACLTRLIPSTSSRAILVTGSWNHPESILPYYINVDFRGPAPRKGQSGIMVLNILFNLRTTEIIEVERFITDGSGERMRDLGIPLGCNVSRRKN